MRALSAMYVLFFPFFFVHGQTLLRIVDASVLPEGRSVRIDPLSETSITVSDRSPVSRRMIVLALSPKCLLLQDMLEHKDELPGSLTLNLTIAANGDVTNVRIPEPKIDAGLYRILETFWSRQRLDLRGAATSFTVRFRIHDGRQAGSNEKERGLPVDSIGVAAAISGTMVEVATTVVFVNNEQRILEGELVFPLPARATLTGYALDINGRLVDGVAVEKEKARKVFETEKRRRIDPGIVEWVDGNVFRTRVYPIPARGKRTVRVSSLIQLAPGEKTLQWLLPAVAVRRYTLTVTDESGTRRLLVDDTNTKVPAAPAIPLPPAGRTPTLVETFSDTAFFWYQERAVFPVCHERLSPKRPAVFWDCSSSRDSASAALERKALAAALTAWKSSLERISLYSFAHAIIDSLVVEDKNEMHGDRIGRWLDGVSYDGGTAWPDFARLSAGSDLILLFSDGRETMSAWDRSGRVIPSVRMIAASGSENPHVWMLRGMAEKTGGWFVDLRSETILSDRTLPAMLDSVTCIEGALRDIVPSLPTVWNSGSVLLGKLVSKKAEISLHIHDANGRSITSNATLVKGNRTGRLLAQSWARIQAQELLSRGLGESDEMADLGKTYGIVTPRTSLIVLESLDQYFRHKIAPPVSWPELRKEYENRIAAIPSRDNGGSGNADVQLRTDWQEKVAWWKSVFNPFQRTRPESKKIGRGGYSQSIDAILSGVGGLRDGGGGSGRRGAAGIGYGSGYGSGFGGSASGGVDDLIGALDQEAPPQPRVNAIAMLPSRARADENAYTGPVIALKEWTPDMPYVKALDAAVPAGRWQVYLGQKRAYATAPSFYADCADFFFRKRDRAHAIRILGNIPELCADDPAMLRIAAHALSRREVFQWSLPLFRTIKALIDEEPQSWRDYGLELFRYAATQKSREKRFIMQESWGNLNWVAHHSWQRFNELGEIALTERNPIQAYLKTLGVNLESDGMNTVLASDLRIVLTWDADETDVDLWVDEPSGERVKYDNNLSGWGGRLSRDFTGGYGPEEYMIRKARPGTYTIRAHFYGSNATRLQGAVTLRADIYASFGKPNERHRIMTLRLASVKSVVEIGKIVVGKDGSASLTER